MSRPGGLSRRAFCQVAALAAGGLLVHVRTLGANGSRAGAAPTVFAPNVFVAIDRDNEITIIVARSEIGQGVRTSLPMLVAEELDADWSKIRIEQAAFVDRNAYGDQYAGGSQSVRNGWRTLREAGALARALIVQAAARQWNVDPQSCRTSRAIVSHPESGRSATYGSLAAAAAALPVPDQVGLKAPQSYTLIGRPVGQRAAPRIVRGTEPFGIDTRVPGMKFASIERAPFFGAQVASLDERAARAIAGVHDVVRIDAATLPGFGDNCPPPAHGVAVIAESTWIALKARRALSITWSGGAPNESTEARRKQCRDLATAPPEHVVRNLGDVDRALRNAHRTLEATYELPLVAHAPMEPMNCVAEVAGERCTLWAPTQNPEAARNVAAAICALRPEDVRVHVTRCGGGFGRRFYADYVGEAVMLARHAGAPVQVLWTREDDMRHGFCRPASLHVMRAALNEQGELTAWSQHLVNAQRGDFLRWAVPGGKQVLPAGDELGPYDFPAGFVSNLRLSATAIRDCPVPLGQWRSVEDSTNVFVYQSFVDEVAHAAGRDPLAFRLDLIGPARPIPYGSRQYDSGRLRRVFEAAARAAGWGESLPPGCGRGIAGSYANSSFVAVVIEVAVDAHGAIRLRRAVAAADIGRVVNPLGATAQIEGSIIFGLSAALKQEITVQNGAVVQANFNDFAVLRMSEAPPIEVHFIESAADPSGCGETGVPPTAPALANAIFAATGKRVRKLPIRAADLASG
jgi:isoquinoline 1-oxidoreductase beta subunit